MVIIGVEQPLSNTALNYHIFLENIKMLYKYFCKCCDQQHYKAILEKYVDSTFEVLADKSSVSLSIYVPVKKPSARKSLPKFS